MKDNDKVHQYLEEMALSFEEKGFPRMAGRVLAWLMIAEPGHQSMPEIVDALDASKSSISTATRVLINFDLIEKIGLRGERKDYYRLKPKLWRDSVKLAVKKMADFKNIAARSLAILGDVNVNKESLQEMHDVYAFLEEQMPLILDAWEKQQNKKPI